MKTILYIHPGIHKTGTTSIQHYLSLNRDVLLNYGIYYPIVPYDSLVPFQHRYITTIEKDKNKITDYFKDALRVSNKVLISSECFLEKDEYRDVLKS